MALPTGGDKTFVFKVRDGGGQVINVKAHGAAGDGVTDDTTAIQAALDAAYSAGGGTVYFPKGTYVTTAVLNHKGNVCIEGADQETTRIESTATRCMQADATNPAGAAHIASLTLVAATGGTAYHTNGQDQVRMRFEKVNLDAGVGGYGLQVTGMWLECEMTQCVISQKMNLMPLAGGGVVNVCKWTACRFNATGLKPADGIVVYIGAGGSTAGGFNNVTFDTCNIQTGAIKIGGDAGLTFSRLYTFVNTGIYDASVSGDDGLVLVKAEHVTILSMLAEGFKVRADTGAGASGAVSRVTARQVLCHTFDMQKAEQGDYAGVVSSADAQLDSALDANYSSYFDHEGVVYGRHRFLRRPVSVVLPSRSTNGDVALAFPERYANVIAGGISFHSAVAADASNYWHIGLRAADGTTVVGEFTTAAGTGANGYNPFTSPTVRTNNTREAVLVRYTAVGSPAALPGHTVQFDYVDQGAL